MKYVVLLNNTYMNSFKTYGEAVKLAEELRRKFKNVDIEIRRYEK